MIFFLACFLSCFASSWASIGMDPIDAMICICDKGDIPAFLPLAMAKGIPARVIATR